MLFVNLNFIMPASTADLTQQFLLHLSTRDLDNLTSLYADTVDWDIPGNEARVPWLGVRHTVAEVKDFFQLLWKNTESLSASVYKTVTDDNYVVITGDFSTKMLPTGKVVNSFFCIQLTFEHDRIVRYRLYEDSFAVSEAMA
jgi:ketosteroid isomerase-like protein